MTEVFMLTHGRWNIQFMLHTDAGRNSLTDQILQRFHADFFQHAVAVGFMRTNMTGKKFVGLLFKKIHKRKNSVVSKNHMEQMVRKIGRSIGANSSAGPEAILLLFSTSRLPGTLVTIF